MSSTVINTKNHARIERVADCFRHRKVVLRRLYQLDATQLARLTEERVALLEGRHDGREAVLFSHDIEYFYQWLDESLGIGDNTPGNESFAIRDEFQPTIFR